jgi:hypothetical protein
MPTGTRGEQLSAVLDFMRQLAPVAASRVVTFGEARAEVLALLAAGRGCPVDDRTRDLHRHYHERLDHVRVHRLIRVHVTCGATCVRSPRSRAMSSRRQPAGAAPHRPRRAGVRRTPVGQPRPYVALDAAWPA